MLTTVLFDLDGTLLPFVQDEFIQAYFKTLLRRLGPMGYDGEKLTAALPDYGHIWSGELDGTLSVYIGDGVLGAAVQRLP